MARGPLLIDEKVSDFTFSDIRNPPTPWKQFMLTLILEELVLESKRRAGHRPEIFQNASF